MVPWSDGRVERDRDRNFHSGRAGGARADVAYICSAFIATQEAGAVPEFKQMIVDSERDAYLNLFTGLTAIICADRSCG